MTPSISQCGPFRPEYISVQEKLHKELSTIDFPADGVPSIQRLDALPYLDAVIKEGPRLFAAIPMTLFREVPTEGKLMNGYSLAGGTIVGSQAYSLHRNEETYPTPNPLTHSVGLTWTRKRNYECGDNSGLFRLAREVALDKSIPR
jgi:Cytochrome P450